MVEQDIKRRLTVETDDGSIRKAKQHLEELKQSNDELTRSFKRGGGTDEFRKELSETETQLTETKKAFNDLADTIGRGDLKFRIDADVDRFAQISRDVQLAGDVQSNLGALSGLAGAAGAGGLGQGLGIAGELIVLTEELPRLKAAVQGLPAAANAAGKALGLGGAAGLVGALGATVVAIGAVKLALDEFIRAAEAQAQQLRNVFQAQGDVNQQIADGLTTASAQEQIARNERFIELEQKRLDELEAAYQSFEEQAGGALSALAKVISPQEQALADEIKNIRDNLGALGETNAALRGAIDNGLTTAEEAAIAEQELSAARQDTSDVTETKAQEERRAADAAREHEQALREQEQAAQRAANAQQSYNDRLRDIGQSQRDGFEDLDIDTDRAFQDLRIEARRDELQAERDYQNDLADIRNDARNSERDALRGRDFFAQFQQREEEAQAVKERQEERRREDAERLIEIQQQKEDILREEKRSGQDLLREGARQRRDALQQLNDFYRNENQIKDSAYRASLNSAKAWAQAFNSTIASAFNGAGGSGASGNNAGFEQQMRDAFAA